MNEKHTKKVILTGGAGYIGRIVAQVLHQSGYLPILVDNFSTSKKPSFCPFPIYECDLTDLTQTRKVWKEVSPCLGVIHFAARALVFESREKPDLYFKNNLLATLHSVQASVEQEFPIFVHSSSCAVYGIPRVVPIEESFPLAPITPYGNSKWMSEKILEDFSLYKKIKILNLRYFNPAGALNQENLGELHTPETHLIPNIIASIVKGIPLQVFGKNHPTPDGSCIRDYIHIEDLANAHVLAMEYLLKNQNNEQTLDAPSPFALNLGLGRGHSVFEILSAAEKVFGRPIPYVVAPPREGDPPILVANSAKAYSVLGWQPQKTIAEMIESHYQWIKNQI